MALFLIIGVFGLVVLLGTLLLDDVFDAVTGAIGLEGGGFLSGPAIGAFLAAFGFGGALAQSAGVSGPLSVLAATGGGVAIGAVAGLLTRALMRMPTDATPSAGSLAGLTGTVTTAIPAAGFGEVTLLVAGAPTKVNARAAGPVAAGMPVRVAAVLSPTSVLVEPA